MIVMTKARNRATSKTAQLLSSRIRAPITTMTVTLSMSDFMITPPLCEKFNCAEYTDHNDRACSDDTAGPDLEVAEANVHLIEDTYDIGFCGNTVAQGIFQGFSMDARSFGIDATGLKSVDVGQRIKQWLCGHFDFPPVHMNL